MPLSMNREITITREGGQVIIVGPEDVIEQQKTIIKSKDGSIIALEQSDKIETETTFVVECSGPKCASRNDAEKPFNISWVAEKVAHDPNSVPDGFFRLINIKTDPASPKEYAFCGPQCARDWLIYEYTPPKSPKERLAELNPHLHENVQNPEVAQIAAEEKSDVLEEEKVTSVD